MSAVATLEGLGVLTKDEVKAIRNADYAYITHAANSFPSDQSWSRVGRGAIHLTTKVTVNGYEVEARRDIEVESTINDYTEHPNPAKLSGHCHIGAPRFHRVWHGISQEVKAGDQLALYWVRGNDSETTRKAGLSMDECYIVLKRKASRHHLYFIVEALATQTDSLSRMLRAY